MLENVEYNRWRMTVFVFDEKRCYKHERETQNEKLTWWPSLSGSWAIHKTLGHYFVLMMIMCEGIDVWELQADL
jgi:hypothetical protein